MYIEEALIFIWLFSYVFFCYRQFKDPALGQIRIQGSVPQPMADILISIEWIFYVI